jgi:hypothetical protein
MKLLELGKSESEESSDRLAGAVDVGNMVYPGAGETITHSRPLAIYTGLLALGMRIFFL